MSQEDDRRLIIALGVISGRLDPFSYSMYHDGVRRVDCVILGDKATQNLSGMSEGQKREYRDEIKNLAEILVYRAIVQTREKND